MEALLGFPVSGWDYLTFLAIFIIGVAFLALVIFILGLPGQAQYYLDNTTLVASEDGRIINLQVRPGMVSGIYRIGGIAALIAEADRYVLATYYQENLKYVRPEQPAEISLDLYPG
jgi:hypothetical protein